MLSNVRFVLVNPSHPGNIGATARAMKNMCLQELYIVAPKHYPSAEATARASGADDILASARVCDSLQEALEGCSLVMGVSARIRSLRWPQITPRECADKVIAEHQQAAVALVFGREHAGLTNEELALCNYLVHIPSNQVYSSLNLAAAAQVIAYEIYANYPKQQPTEDNASTERLATSDEIEHYFAHLEQILIDIDFLNPQRPRRLMQRLRRMYNRIHDQNEINILRGILTAIKKKIQSSV
ncbi:MAG: RNA methyltransferase [Gammaproteobacteria bacterium]|nr:RNA methyltransferase [Gammaproteobacteria bacterium]